MKPKWLQGKFWFELLGIVVSCTLAAVAAFTGKPEDRLNKISLAVLTAGLLVAILRSRYDVLKELDETRNTVRDSKSTIATAIKFYIDIIDAVHAIDSIELKNRAEQQIKEVGNKIHALADGQIILDPDESISFQANRIRSANERIYAIHTVDGRRDLEKWKKKDGDFNELKQAFFEAKQKLPKGSMTRVFVVASDLLTDPETMQLLHDIKSLSEKELGFKSSIVLRNPDSLQRHKYPSLLLVDSSSLIIVETEPGATRKYEIVAYEGKGFKQKRVLDNFVIWMALQNEPDQSNECFAALI